MANSNFRLYRAISGAFRQTRVLFAQARFFCVWAAKPPRCPNDLSLADLGLKRNRSVYLLAVAINNAHNRREAEEAVQEALISFIRRFDPEGPAPALPWLLLTLKRQCWRQGRDAHLDRLVGQEVERGDDERGTIIESLRSPGTDFETRIADIDEARRRVGRVEAPGAHRPGCLRGWLLLPGDCQPQALDLHQGQPLHARGANSARGNLSGWATDTPCPPTYLRFQRPRSGSQGRFASDPEVG